jgi:hypothetical protein
MHGAKVQRFFDLPLKMEPIQCSETSAISTETPGKHPKEIIFRKHIKLSHSHNSTNLIRKCNTFPEKVMDRLRHGFPNPGNQIVVETKFLSEGATYFGALMIDLASCVTVLAPRILIWLPDFCKMCTHLDYVRF